MNLTVASIKVEAEAVDEDQSNQLHFVDFIISNIKEEPELNIVSEPTTGDNEIIHCKKFDSNDKVQQQKSCHQPPKNKSDDDSKAFICDKCPKSFCKRYVLTRHGKVVHCDNEPFLCDICNKTLKTKDYLVKHMAIHSAALSPSRASDARPVIVKIFKCDICDKTFKSRFLRKHMLIHTDKPVNCKVCDKVFLQKYALSNHMVVHFGERKHKCSICDKGFLYKSQLAEHVLFHTGVKPFKCDVCDQRFARNCDLTKHTIMHSGSKPFGCNLCDKKFCLQYHLDSHMASHTSQNKPFKCDVCDKTFSYLKYKKKHELLHIM